MKHYMNLHPEPFAMIANGKKTIELRLNDEKRQIIKVGDFIEFQSTQDNLNKLLVKVVNIYKFNSFEELYNTLPLDKCGYEECQIESALPDDMALYYSKENQDKYGVLGIEVSTEI